MTTTTDSTTAAGPTPATTGKRNGARRMGAARTDAQETEPPMTATSAATVPDESEHGTPATVPRPRDADVVQLPTSGRADRRRTGLPDRDPLPTEKWDDLGAGRRFATLYRDRVRYVPVTHEWMVWDGRRWARDKGKQVQRWAHAVARRMLVWAAKIDDSDQRKRALRAAEYACSAGGNAAMLTMASAVEWIATEADVFDAHPDMLNCANGIVDLRTGELHPHDPKHLITLCTGVSYIKGATHPDWGAALTAMPPEEIPWFQVRAGQGFTGYPPDDDVLFLMRGGGENGKSTLVIGIAQSGGDYARLISERALLADPRAHPTELMEFKGCRFAYTEELPEGGTLNAARLKKTVGTPTMTARAMHRDSETWIATHSMFLGTNPLPVVNETDHGTWRRLMLQEYRVKYLKPGDPGTGAPHERRGDPGLRTRLRDGKAQHEAVLAWLIEGARRWYAAGRVMPPTPRSVVASTAAWRAKSDLVYRYFSERLRADPEYITGRAEIYTDFGEWLKAHGQSEWSRRTFDDRFGQHDLVRGAGIQEKTVKPQGKKLSRRVDPWSQTLPSTLKVWTGVRFVTPDEEDADAEE